MIGFWLGTRSLLREPAALIYASIALAAVLGPLIVLLGLKNGVVHSLMERLRSDPANRELVLRGNYAIRTAMFEEIAARPEIGFIVPATRSIAARLEFNREDRGGLSIANVLPTASGDPLAAKGAWVDGTEQIALSEALARRVGVSVGARIQGRNSRTDIGGREASIVFDFTVVAIVARGSLEQAFAMPSVLQTLEAFLDGYAIPLHRLDGRDQALRVDAYENMRLYAKDLEAVAPLEKYLSGAGFNVSSRSAEIDSLVELERNFDIVLLLMSSIAALSYLISLFTTVAIQIRSTRRQLSLFRLFGGSPAELVSFPLAQSLIVTATGTVLSFAIYLAVAAVVERTLSRGFGTKGVAVLWPGDIILVLAATMVGALLVVAAMAARLRRIPPSEVLRND